MSDLRTVVHTATADDHGHDGVILRQINLSTDETDGDVPPWVFDTAVNILTVVFPNAVMHLSAPHLIELYHWPRETSWGDQTPNAAAVLRHLGFGHDPDDPYATYLREHALEQELAQRAASLSLPPF